MGDEVGWVARGVLGVLNGERIGDLTAAAKDVGRGTPCELLFIDAPGNMEISDGRDLARELEVDVVSLSAIGFELGVPGGVGGTKWGDCNREAEDDNDIIVAGLRGEFTDRDRAATALLYLPMGLETGAGGIRLMN